MLQCTTSTAANPATSDNWQAAVKEEEGDRFYTNFQGGTIVPNQPTLQDCMTVSTTFKPLDKSQELTLRKLAIEQRGTFVDTVSICSYCCKCFC